MGIGENAGNQHFLLFPQCFLPFPNQISIFQSHLFCHLQIPSIWTSLKLCCLGKGNPLANDKFFDWSKSTGLADNKINVTEKLKFVSGRAANIVGKGENAGSQHFLFFSTMFSKAFFPRVVKRRDCVVKGLKAEKV